MTIAIIPVKRLEQSKSRLLPELPDERRQALTLAMLEDLIEALQAAGCIERIAVTTPDPTVASRARAAGAEVLLRPEPGLNAALEDAAGRLAPAPDEALLVVLGDVAGALPGDLRRLVEAAHAPGAPPAGVWLAPSADGGTSALLIRPKGVIPFCFGVDSAARHREAARAADVAYHEPSLASLAIDLDQPEDLATFLATEGGGRRTRALLGRPRDAVAAGAAGADEAVGAVGMATTAASKIES
ncbi:MAG: 2-phospho-L-lactate guanylyltransferase [Thermoleophilia bacterium]|nr:2-phospho-L-lactate guanylyltransferase [Thermoleophilia bacterium]